jgi:AcrR family transcriptional regulator
MLFTFFGLASERRTREEQTGDRRAAILAAARAAFARHGYRDATIAEIAKATGLAEGTIYKHFANKQDLLLHVMGAFYERIIADLEASVARERTLAGGLRAIVRRQLQAFVEDRDLCRLFIRELRAADGYAQSPLHELNRRYTSILLRALAAGKASGEMRGEVEPRLVRDVLYGAVEHVAWRSLVRGARLPVEAASEQIVGLLLHGMGRRAA